MSLNDINDIHESYLFHEIVFIHIIKWHILLDLRFILSALIISFMSDYSSSYHFLINSSIKLIQGKVKLNSGKNLFQEKWQCNRTIKWNLLILLLINLKKTITKLIIFDGFPWSHLEVKRGRQSWRRILRCTLSQC